MDMAELVGGLGAYSDAVSDHKRPCYQDNVFGIIVGVLTETPRMVGKYKLTSPSLCT